MTNLSTRQVVFRGKLFQVEQARHADGRTFEWAVRAPGVRLIIADRATCKVLLTKEFRDELNTWDYRLPGGKVFDTMDAYDAQRASGEDIQLAAERKAVEEGSEEAGVIIKALKFFKKSTLGATVECDLYCFEVTDWEQSRDGQQLKEDEQIEADSWFSYDQARQMILNGDMQEERVALVLLQWLERQR